MITDANSLVNLWKVWLSNQLFKLKVALSTDRLELLSLRSIWLTHETRVLSSPRTPHFRCKKSHLRTYPRSLWNLKCLSSKTLTFRLWAWSALKIKAQLTMTARSCKITLRGKKWVRQCFPLHSKPALSRIHSWMFRLSQIDQTMRRAITEGRWNNSICSRSRSNSLSIWVANQPKHSTTQRIFLKTDHKIQVTWTRWKRSCTRFSLTRCFLRARLKNMSQSWSKFLKSQRHKKF